VAKKYKKFRIIRDTREKVGHGYKFRASANCLPMTTIKLDVGDYSIEGYEDKIMVERKTIADLWGTLTSGRVRFMKEMARAENHTAKYLVIEGTLADVNKGIPYSKVRAEYIMCNLISLELKHNVHVIFTSKRVDVAQGYVRRLLKKLFQYCEDGVI
jgi:ERCC4-type nuclease